VCRSDLAHGEDELVEAGRLAPLVTGVGQSPNSTRGF
jgi:hypothetical protein